MEESESQDRLPLLVQLIHGTYQYQKTKEAKSLAHEKGHGAQCSNCGPECSGFDLHFWRKVCKNCGCRPQAHDIKVNEMVHKEIVKGLFEDSEGERTLSESSRSGDVDRQIIEKEPEQRLENTITSVPEIRIESINLDDTKKGCGRSGGANASRPSKIQTETVTSYVTPEPKVSPKVTKPSAQDNPTKDSERSDESNFGFKDTAVPNRPSLLKDLSLTRRSGKSKVLDESQEHKTIEKSKEQVSTPVPPPRRDSFVEVERQRQLLNQLPPQDFDPKFCSTLNRKQKQAMNKMSDIKKQAAGKGKLAREDASIQVCKGCNSDITIGENAITSTHEQEVVFWHQHCFKCNSCQEKIVDYIYFWHEGNIYCGRHFAERYRPRCAACDELIYAEKYTKAEGTAWHMEHFTCFICDKNLADTNYISHKGQPHCMTCYHFKVASKCRSCGLPIQVGEARISHENVHWHAYPECFFCRGCNKDLVDAGFLLVDGKVYCSSRCSRNASQT